MLMARRKGRKRAGLEGDVCLCMNESGSIHLLSFKVMVGQVSVSLGGSGGFSKWSLDSIVSVSPGNLHKCNSLTSSLSLKHTVVGPAMCVLTSTAGNSDVTTGLGSRY